MAKVGSSGSITQLEQDKTRGKCRKWQLRAPMGLNPRTGKYKVKSRRFTGTYTEAKRALRDFIAEIESDQVHRRAGTTMEACAASFMERRRASGEFADNTNELYERFFKAINRHVGKADASQVDRDVIERMWSDMRAGDTLSGRPASGTYLHQLHRTLSLLFDDLAADGIVAKNPCRELSTPQNDTEERRALKSDRMRSLVRGLEVGEEADMAYFIAITMGLRRGEVCALSWDDVDFDARTVTVSHSFDHFLNLKATKTRAGFRRLPMPEFVSDAFMRHKLAQRDRLEQSAAGNEALPRQTEESPVIVDRRGARVNPDNLGAWWRRDRKVLGLDGWCLHELRHSYLSMLAEEGVHPKVMQELAGHADSKITMDIYMHVNMGIKRAAAEAAAEVFSQRGEEEKMAARAEADAPGETLDNVIAFVGGHRNQERRPELVQTPGRFEPHSNHQTALANATASHTTVDLQVC